MEDIVIPSGEVTEVVLWNIWILTTRIIAYGIQDQIQTLYETHVDAQRRASVLWDP